MSKKNTSMKKSKKKDKLTIVRLNFDSHFRGVVYEAGEHKVDSYTAKRLLEINKILKGENK